MTQIIINETTPIVVEVSTPGPQGSSGTATVGTVTTGAAGSAAAVTNSGTPSAAVFNFTIPKGDIGDVTPAATAAKNAAEAAAIAAAASELAAETAEQAAEDSATAALASATSASASATTASTKAQEASTSASNAAASAQSVSTAANTATTKAAEAAASATAALSSANTATTKAQEAAGSATTASTKAQEAVVSATTATNKATEASASAATALSAQQVTTDNATLAIAQANIASAKAAAANTSANDALVQASVATTKAAEATAQATTATTQAGIATTQATTATTQAGIATTQANTATTQAGIATTKATEASASATAAAASASAASTSQTAAASSASAANTSASNASASASTATTQATTATTQAGIATEQATTATTQAGIATTQATAASSSATTAVNAANTATAQATVASTKASEASASASNSQASATAAATAQTSASASASTATAQATLAGTARTAAETARDAAIVAQNNAVAVVTGGTATLTPSAGKIPLSDAQGKIAKGWLTNTDLVEQTDIGTAPNEIPLNQFLGELAYLDAQNIPTLGINVANAATANVTNLMQVTEISNAVPSLNLDFAKVKQLDPRITFTRASTGTYYDGKTVAKAEENLFLQSQAFDNAAWVNGGTITTTANTTAAPDGTITADRLQLAAGNTFKYQNISLVSGATYVISVYVLSNTGSNQTFRLFGNDLSSSSADQTATTSWQRVTFTYTASSASSVAVGIRTDTANTAADILVWGAQLEQRASATAYTPTTTQAVTTYIPVLQTAAAGVPRFEHNPVTGESLGLEIEEQRTNLLTYSEQFDNAAWTKGGATITANTVVAPDGNLTGDKLIEDTSTGDHRTFQTAASITTGVAYTFSTYVKPAGRTLVKLTSAIGAVMEATYDISAGTVTNTVSGTAAIVSAGNGWYRLSLSVTASATVSTNMQIRLVDTGTNTTYTGNGFSGIYIWGAQLEAGAFPTSYIPTVASQVTRAADSAVMTGANFSSWYRQSEGTVYMEADGRQPSVTFSNANAGYANYRPFYRQPNQTGQPFIGSDINAGVTSSDIYAGPTNALPFRAAYAYANNNFAGSVNGLTAVTDNSGQPALAVNRMGIGFDYGANTTLSGLFKKITYYPQRLSNAELVEMTA